jgi:cell wall-associated NlpC family hydrolase
MGDLLFFGKDLQNIVHVAMALDNVRMIEAGGGGSKCTTVCAAAQQNAYIRVRPIARRPDLVAICRPNYPATQ